MRVDQGGTLYSGTGGKLPGTSCLNYTPGHNLTGIALQFAMHLGFTCDVISVTHHSD